jgi:pimeloyl-ACP methyl ester carboxylesterase
VLVSDRYGDGPAVVLLHGQPGSRADWRRVVPLLEADHTVLVPDRPGYGATAGPAAGFVSNADETVRLLDAERIDTAVFVGYSWSGGVALAAATRHARRVSGLVLVASVRPGEPLGWGDRLLAVPAFGEVFGALTIGVVGSLVRMKPVQDLLDRRLSRSAREAARVVAGATGGSGGARVWRSFAAEQRYLLSELDALAGEVKEIAAPTVVLSGGADHVVPAAAGARLAASIPGAGYRLIPGANHLLPFEHPQDIAAAVRSVGGLSRGA